MFMKEDGHVAHAVPGEEQWLRVIAGREAERIMIIILRGLRAPRPVSVGNRDNPVVPINFPRA